MKKRQLKVTNAIMRGWGILKDAGVYVVYADLAEDDNERRWAKGQDIRTSQIVSVNGVAVKDIPGKKEGPLHAGDVVETLNTIYEVV